MNSTQASSSSPRQWFVLEGDWGGQIYATVPAHLMPTWARRKRVRKALAHIDRLNWKQPDGTQTYIIQDFGPLDATAVYAGVATEDELAVFLEAREALERAQDAAPRGVLVEHTPAKPISWRDSETYVRGWRPVGGVPGGMGGGALLANDIWLNVSVLMHGLEEVNRVRAILGIAPLASLRVHWSQEDRRYADYPQWPHRLPPRQRPSLRRLRARIRPRCIR